MSRKVYLHLFILCGIFSHVIVMISSEENIKESSDLLHRKKRVLNHEAGVDATVRMMNFPYVVQVKKHKRPNCVGNILSHHTVITAATCLIFEVAVYSVSSGSSYSNGGKTHNVTEKKTYFGSTLPRARARDGIALITVEPPFVYNQYTNKIDLHEGILLSNTLGTVAGWGFINARLSGILHPERLRAITVPIMDHRECKNIYHDFANITEKEICTFHTDKHCGHTDVGAGLVVNNTLAGIHIWGGQIITKNKPDVFALVQHLEYSNWIRENIV